MCVNGVYRHVCVWGMVCAGMCVCVLCACVSTCMGIRACEMEVGWASWEGRGRAPANSVCLP